MLLICIIIDKNFLIKGFIANFFLSSTYLFFIDFCRRKNGQKQVKKKAFIINAKIEDVGLNED